jgi:hypothetical protein
MSDVIVAGNAGATPAIPRGRLIFALDATASREPTWNAAVEVQAEMFRTTAPIGLLDVKLVYFRGASECRASGWQSSGEQLAQLMRRISCEPGETQIGRALTYARREAEQAPVQGIILIGDSVEENADELAGIAAELGRLHTPVHTFLEGHSPVAKAAFRLIALRSGGQFHRFGVGTPQAVAQLGAKLSNVAKLAVQNAALLTHRSN